jgi:hypothetical protein
MLNFGGFLSSNFWTNYRCQSSQSIEDLLNKKDCTVDKLLDDDDCLQELKNFNEKLIKYFDHDKLKVLIDYITVMPKEDAGHNRGHKYPFMAGEIFNCEINQILDKFFEAPAKPVKEPVEENADSNDKKDSKSQKNSGETPGENPGAKDLEAESDNSTASEKSEEEKKEPQDETNPQSEDSINAAEEEAKNQQNAQEPEAEE